MYTDMCMFTHSRAMYTWHDYIHVYMCCRMGVIGAIFGNTGSHMDVYVHACIIAVMHGCA